MAMKVLLRCGGDSDTGCGERGADTYECTHTNIASHGAGAVSGHRDTGLYTPASPRPDQNTGAWPDHRGPE